MRRDREERVDAAEALTLYCDASTWLLGRRGATSDAIDVVLTSSSELLASGVERNPHSLMRRRPARARLPRRPEPVLERRLAVPGAAARALAGEQLGELLGGDPLVPVGADPDENN